MKIFKENIFLLKLLWYNNLNQLNKVQNKINNLFCENYVLKFNYDSFHIVFKLEIYKEFNYNIKIINIWERGISTIGVHILHKKFNFVKVAYSILY